jgi:multimeric flavodoxin WrbA
LGLVGSYRKGGNTDVLVRKVLEGAGNQGFETTCLYLPDYQIRDCNGCEGCRKSARCVVQDDMQKLYPLLEEADGLVIGSPTYFYNVTGIMKNFLDRLYCFDFFDETDRSVWIGLFELAAAKYAVTVAVCEQESEADMGYTSPAMSRSLEAVGYRVVENVKALRLFEKGRPQTTGKAF